MRNNNRMESEAENFGFLRPKEYASSVFTIDIDRLYRMGIRGIIVDLDDTLIPRPEYRVPFSIYSWVEKVKERGMNICIVSNGGSSKRVEYISDSLNIKGFSLSFKPLPFAFNKALSHLGTQPGQTAVIGDQIITDVVGGNMIGAYTILVKPVSREVSLVRLPMRYIEEGLLKFLNLEIDS
jgi:uncharacterized protein